tara:strand:- start:73 stop:228 length:156 start_codon:yes stop_codon:yes gene_type:complete
MKKVGTTFDVCGNRVRVYECEDCGNRVKRLQHCVPCEIKEHHMEEAAAGIL